MNVDFNTPIETAEAVNNRLSQISALSNLLAKELNSLRNLTDFFGEQNKESIQRNINIALADVESVHLRTTLASLFLDKVIKEKQDE